MLVARSLELGRQGWEYMRDSSGNDTAIELHRTTHACTQIDAYKTSGLHRRSMYCGKSQCPGFDPTRWLCKMLLPGEAE